MEKKEGVRKRRRGVANYKQYQGGGRERGRKWQEKKIKKENEGKRVGCRKGRREGNRAEVR